MSKKIQDISKTTVFRLIEAGFMSRQALVTPLQKLGLEHGDDAVLLSLSDSGENTDTKLAQNLGIDQRTLRTRIHRLEGRGVVQRTVNSDSTETGITLTELGERLSLAIQEHWQDLEDALMADLDHKERKNLRRALKNFVGILIAAQE